MEQNDKYEERVRQRAEQMAKAFLPHVFAKQNELINLVHIDNMLPAARLAVQWEAEAVKISLEPNHTSEYIDLILELCGLIPSPEKTKG